MAPRIEMVVFKDRRGAQYCDAPTVEGGEGASLPDEI
jgi:hypothetical protein